MAVQGRRLSWKWNYFAKLTNDRVKCIICGEPFWFVIQKDTAKRHFKTRHNKYPSVSSNHSSEGWQSQFTTQNDKMKCKLCGKLYGFKKNITMSMANHLKKTHETDENKTTKIITYLYNISYDENLKKEKYKCKKCSYKFSGDYNNNKSSDLIKHLIDNHHTDIPANIRPKGLCESSSTLNYDEGADSATSSNYQQLNQLCESSSTSNYDEGADSATSSNYQQPNQLCEISNPSNYDGEAGIVTSINYQQPYQLYELSNPLNNDGEAGIATSVIYQQPIQLGEVSSLLNYDGSADIRISNYQQPNVYSSDSDRSNKLPSFSDVFKNYRK